MKIYDSILTIIILLCLQHVTLIHSIQVDINNDSPWPHFYHLGESTHPTQSILRNLTYYQAEWHRLQSSEGFGETYSFTMAWDCAPSQCNRCFQANKFINVDDDVITTLTTSILNDDSKIMACQNSNTSNDKSQYKTIDELYRNVIDFVASGLGQDDYLIIELMLHRYYFFPMAVKLSEGNTYYAWDIPCFEPLHKENEEDVCQYTSSTNTSDQWTFWISEEMQSFIGWSMIFLILVACSLGYCINWLKKKKAEKIEAWREKEERQRNEEKEKESSGRKKKGKGKRKSSKAKHKSHLEKSKREKNKSEHEYSNVPILNASDHSDGSNINDHYDDIEEQKHDIQ